MRPHKPAPGTRESPAYRLRAAAPRTRSRRPESPSAAGRAGFAGFAARPDRRRHSGWLGLARFSQLRKRNTCPAGDARSSATSAERTGRSSPRRRHADPSRRRSPPDRRPSTGTTSDHARICRVLSSVSSTSRMSARLESSGASSSLRVLLSPMPERSNRTTKLPAAARRRAGVTARRFGPTGWTIPAFRMTTAGRSAARAAAPYAMTPTRDLRAPSSVACSFTVFTACSQKLRTHDSRLTSRSSERAGMAPAPRFW